MRGTFLAHRATDRARKLLRVADQADTHATTAPCTHTSATGAALARPRGLEAA